MVEKVVQGTQFVYRVLLWLLLMTYIEEREKKQQCATHIGKPDQYWMNTSAIIALFHFAASINKQ